jgi:serine/threonine-protein kinase PknG
VFGPDELIGVDEVRPDWRLLPRPKVDGSDPGAGFLMGLADGAPALVAATLTEALAGKTVAESTEVLLRLARAQLEVGDTADARGTLDRVGQRDDWRVWWHRGLHALATGAAEDAVGWLDPVYTELPGEVAAKLALALAHELAGDLARSAALYDVASRTDPSHVSGAFGLARVRRAAGDREGAVDALGRVPAASSVHVAARVAAVRALASTTQVPGAPPHPTTAQLDRASALLDQLKLDPRRHALLAQELYEAGLATLAHGGPRTGLVEESLREGLEATYRQLARLATTTGERHDLVDRANRTRPRTLL